MVTNQETFIINDIDMEINPSDIQVMDDNWVMEESYLRSKAVFCYRSKYSATKVVLNIPFQVTYFDPTTQTSLNNTYNCIKLASQLCAYPFCFIKNNRIRSYVSPTTMSVTDHMIFVVDEIAIVQDAQAANICFLEVVLQYFNHVPLIQDFEFRSNLGVALDKKNNLVIKDIPATVVNSLKESTVWKQYMNPKVNTAITYLLKSKIFETNEETDNKSIHPAMGVKILAPVMSVMEKNWQADAGKYVGENTKIVSVTNISDYDNGTMEEMLASLSTQDFSFDREVVQKASTISTINDEQLIKPTSIKEKNLKTTPTASIITNPFYGTQTSTSKKVDDNLTNLAQNNVKSTESMASKTTDVFIDWVSHSLSDLALGVQKIEVRRKNRLVTHPIGAYKHPVVQYMGRYPVTASLVMSTSNHDIYKDNTDSPTHVFIKQITNLLDYNRISMPEAEAYNFLKIQSLATSLLGAEAFLPSQTVISASSNSQGVENIVYSFSEGDLSSFVEDTIVEASGKNELDKVDSLLIHIIIEFLKGMPQVLTEMVTKQNTGNTTQRNSHILTIYKSILELANEAMKEMTLTTIPQYEGLTSTINNFGDIKSGINTIRRLRKIDGSGIDYLEKFTLYSDIFKRTQDVNEITYNESYGDALNAGGLTSSVGANASTVGSIKKAEQDRIDNAESTKYDVPVLTVHNHLIPFLVAIITARNTLENGGTSKIPLVNFTPGGRFNSLALSIISAINSGINSGVVVNSTYFDKKLNDNLELEITKESANSKPNKEKIAALQKKIKENTSHNEQVDRIKDAMEGVSERYAKVFFGQNLEDLELELLSPTEYNKQEDVLVPEIDPFFFIKEKPILGGNEFEMIYDRMYRDAKYNPNLLDNLNNSTPDVEEEDATISQLGVTYRKLKEIDFVMPQVNDNPTYYGGVGFDTSNLNGPGYNSKKSLKQVPQNIIDAIERALRKYNKDQDKAFRSYVYATLHIESTNGANLQSPTGAMGIFQFTTSAVSDVLRQKTNTIEYSSGRRIGVTSSTQIASQVKAISKTDHYLNAQLFIEYTFLYNNKNTIVNGKISTLYLYVKHNQGSGGLNEIVAVANGTKLTLDSNVRSNILKQGISGTSGKTDKELVQIYLNYMKSKISIDNVPTSVSSSTSTLPLTNSSRNTSLVEKTVKDLATSVVTASKHTSSVPLVYSQKTIETKKKQEAAVSQINHVYQGITTSKEDQHNYSIGNLTLTGKVTKVIDGDTVDFLNTKNNTTIRVRLYGVDAPESTTTKEVYGENAKAALTDLVLNKAVTVQLGGVTSEDGDTKRNLGLIKTQDGTDVSLALIRNGYAFSTTDSGYTSIGLYSKAETEAKEAQAGLWKYPAGVVSRPRSNAPDLTKLSTDQLASLKNSGVKYQSFTAKDLEQAQKANGPKLNNFVPLAKGSTYRISALFGELRDKNSRTHKGVDFASNPAGSNNLLGATIIAAASGTASVRWDADGFGHYVVIDHGNKFSTIYAHMSKALVTNGQKVVAGQSIGLVGNTGSSTGPHLHYEVKFNGKHVNPFGTKELTMYKPGDNIVDNNLANLSVGTDTLEELKHTRTGVTDANTVFNEDLVADAIFKNIYKYTNTGLSMAVPAIKVYMTFGNENDKFWLDTLKGDVLYYELKGVKSFHMNCNNDGNPIDTAILSIADPSFLNTDGFAGISKMQGVNINAIGTSQELQFKNNRIQVKVGNKLQVRIGTGNNPNNLDIVFNGSIVEVESVNQSLNIVCESFGKELLSEIFAPHKPLFLNNQTDNISSSSVIGESLIAETIEHFGYNSGFLADKVRSSTDPEDRALSPKVFSLSYSYGFDFTPASYQSRLFMNVFSPEIEKLDDTFYNYNGWVTNISRWFTNHAIGYPFAAYRMTPWQCMKQMEYRHPNTICKPLMYEDRMTLFFGIKEQMYFKKDLSKALQLASGLQKQKGKNNGYDLATYYDRRTERMSPACNIHLATSTTNIISNGLKLNSNYATRIRVNYYDDASDIEENKFWNLETFEANADDNLYPFDIRSKELTLSGCLGKYNAFLYGTTELKKEAEKMYSGKILLLGNASIKAGDYVFIDDAEKRMQGLVLVRECYHHFDEKTGYMTEIVPGQYVEPANFLYSSLWLNLMCTCKIVSSKIRTVVGSNFSAQDFNLVTDYLTVIRQAELALDKINARENDKTTVLEYTAYTGLSVLLMNSVAKTFGVGKTFGPLTKIGVNIGAGAVGFSTMFVKMILQQKDKEIYDLVKGHVKSGSVRTVDWIERKSGSDVRGILRFPKAVLVSSKFYEDIHGKYKDSLALRGAYKSGQLALATTIRAGRILGRALLTTVVAATLSNPLTLVLDALFYMAIQYAFAKIEEEQMMRQPLLYFPILRHGKPYVGGMAGVVRNSVKASYLLEMQKTTKEVQKMSNILVGNSDVTNLSSDRSFYIKLLQGIGNTQEDSKKANPKAITDVYGGQLVKNEQTIIQQDKQRIKEAEQTKQANLNIHSQDEYNKSLIKAAAGGSQ